MKNGNKLLINQIKSLTKQLPNNQNKKKTKKKNLNRIVINVRLAENEIIPTVD